MACQFCVEDRRCKAGLNLDFGQEILGQPSPLLSGQTRWADVSVVDLRKP